MIQILELSDKDFKAAIKKMLWEEIIRSFEKMKMEDLNKEIEGN